MTKHAMRALLLAGALFVSACETIRAVNGPYTAGNAYTVTLGRTWADMSAIMPQRPDNVRMLSIDGPFLNRLYLAGAIAPGQFLIKPERRELPTPTFRADMTETELVEFVSDSVAAIGYLRPEAQNLRPANFGAREGVRFELTAQTPEGLNIAGAALIARVGDRLHVMLYVAPAEYYYERNLPDVESVFASAVFGS